MGSDSAVIGGHDILALERFMDDTRHMIMTGCISPPSAAPRPIGWWASMLPGISP